MAKIALPRKFFGRRSEILNPPYLLSIPKNSFENFVQIKVNPYKRKNVGLEHIFRTSFPFKDPDENFILEYLGYEIGDWECNRCGYKPKEDLLGGWDVDCPECGAKLVHKEKFTPEECKLKGLTYSAPLRVMLQLKAK
ncbi:MAG TPA: hypothetical protein EYP32_05125, partial [Aquificaceae bacterium]|nr:hypothetical protein [Aquificaceae bacterium]